MNWFTNLNTCINSGWLPLGIPLGISSTWNVHLEFFTRNFLKLEWILLEFVTWNVSTWNCLHLEWTLLEFSTWNVSTWNFLHLEWILLEFSTWNEPSWNLKESCFTFMRVNSMRQKRTKCAEDFTAFIGINNGP